MVIPEGGIIGATWKSAASLPFPQSPTLSSALPTWVSLSQTPTAGGPSDVTYAQLDQRILAQRTARAAPPPSMEPTADFSTYAALAGH